MLGLLLSQLIITVVCFLTGCVFYEGPLKPGNRSSFAKPFFFYLITGLIVLTLIAQLIVLFTGVDKAVFLAIVSVLAVVIWLCKIKPPDVTRFLKQKLGALSPLQWLVLGSGWFVILLINAGPTMMDDTESYHIQMIKWTHEFGTVPGIVNLHERYGFNSSWFSSVGLFLNLNNSIRSYTVLNGVVSLWFLAYLVKEIGYTISKKKSPVLPFLVVLIFCLFSWPMIRGNAATANYDFITTFIVFVLFANNFHAKQDEQHDYLEWMIWPAYLFTVRIINYPMLLLSVFAFIRLLMRRDRKTIAGGIVIATLLVAPFIIRNIIVGGYPFYPATQFDFFDVDWKPDGEMITRLKDFIKYYNRVNVSIMALDQTRQLEFPNWIPYWFKHLLPYDTPLIVASILGLLSYPLLLIKYANKSSVNERIFVIVILAQLISWFAIAPDPRFVYGPLLCCCFLPMHLAGSGFESGKAKIVIKYVMLAISISLLAYGVSKIYRDARYRNILKPRPLPAPALKTFTIDGIEMYVPEKIPGNWNRRCYDTQLPCLYSIDPRLRARGKNMRDGFRLEN
jgi:hypothetical protein